MLLWYDHARDGDARPILNAPAPPAPSAEESFRRRCYLNAVTDPATVAELWAAESERRRAGAKPGTRRRRRRPDHD